MSEKNPTIARLKRLIRELEAFGYDDLAEEVRDDLGWWRKVGGGGTGGDLSSEELAELARKASCVSWDSEGLAKLGSIGAKDEDEGSKE